MKDEAKIDGYFDVEVIRDTGHGPQTIYHQKVHNALVLSGKKQIWRMVTGKNAVTANRLFKWFRLGTCGAAVAPLTDTNVKSPITGTLAAATAMTCLAGTRTMQWMISYASGAGTKSANVKEMAVLNKTTGGTYAGASCMSRAVLSPAAQKTTADKLKITYTARIS